MIGAKKGKCWNHLPYRANTIKSISRQITVSTLNYQQSYEKKLVATMLCI